MESIMGKKISYLAEKYQRLPETQIGAKKGKFTETALELLTEQVHTIWRQGSNKIATLLSIDNNLRRRKISRWITDWINSFLDNQSTTLAIYQNVTKQFAVRTGIPQGSFFSPILYLRLTRYQH